MSQSYSIMPHLFSRRKDVKKLNTFFAQVGMPLQDSRMSLRQMRRSCVQVFDTNMTAVSDKMKICELRVRSFKRVSESLCVLQA